MENKRKHLEMIEAIVSRMAGNLFFLKGWAVTLIAALLALFARDLNRTYLFIAIFLAFVFWIVDGMFLSQERLFRDLYNEVRKLKEDQIDFSMDTSKYKSYAKNTWIFCFFSRTLFWFYFPVVAALILAEILIR